MNSRMVEQAMWALYRLGPIDTANYHHREHAVRAVIEAMREPTEEMAKAVDNVSREDWQALIDAALQ